jgi:hypothetical protein
MESWIMKLEVGQIIYILSRKDRKVYPAIIIEEICRKTIEEEAVSYVIRLPDKSKTQVKLEEIDADYFVSIQEVEREMKRAAEEQIDIILSSALKMTDAFDKSIKKPVKTIENKNVEYENKKSEITEEDARVMVDLGNGLQAKFDPRVLEV